MGFTGDRRTFLSAGGTAAIAAALPQIRQSGVSPREFGAVGDGKANDLQAVKQAITFALDNGLPVDGGGSTYGVSGDVLISKRTRPHIQRLRLKQLTPGAVSTLAFIDCQEVRVDSAYVHTGDSPGSGSLASAGGFGVVGGSGHRVRNVDVTGDGKLSYASFWRCTDSIFENISVHDGRFEDFELDPTGIRVPDDVVQGIAISDCRDCTFVALKVRNLTGNATYFTQSGWTGNPATSTMKAFPNFRTRGICGGGNINITLIDPQVSNVEQAIDFSGGGENWGNRGVRILGGHTRNCGSSGVKFANAPNGCFAANHTAENCGMAGFMLTGYDTSTQGRDSYFSNCVSINPGYNDVHFDTDGEAAAHSGFWLMETFAGGLVGCWLTACRAIDRQGFYLATDDSPWVLAGGTSATMAEAWTGYTGEYAATFTTSDGTETKTITLTNGSSAITWTGGLNNPVVHPFVSRPSQMRYGFLDETTGTPANTVDGTCVSRGHTIAASKGF